MKSLSSMFVAILFVFATVIVPAFHEARVVGIAHGDQCCGEHSELCATNKEHDNGSLDLHQASLVHDSSACAICQLANLSLDVTAVLAVSSVFEKIVCDNILVFSHHDYSSPRLLPYSCGPPA